MKIAIISLDLITESLNDEEQQASLNFLSKIADIKTTEDILGNKF